MKKPVMIGFSLFLIFTLLLTASGQERTLSDIKPNSKNDSEGALNHLFDLDHYHKKGITGKGVKIAIFDSGLA